MPAEFASRIGERVVMYGNKTWVKPGLNNKGNANKVSPSRRYKRIDGPNGAVFLMSADTAQMDTGYDSEGSSINGNGNSPDPPSLLTRMDISTPSSKSLLERVEPANATPSHGLLASPSCPQLITTVNNQAPQKSPLTPTKPLGISSPKSALVSNRENPPSEHSDRAVARVDDSTNVDQAKTEEIEVPGPSGSSSKSFSTQEPPATDDNEIPGLSMRSIQEAMSSALPPITPTNMCFANEGSVLAIKVAASSSVTSRDQLLSRVRDLLTPLISQNAQRRLPPGQSQNDRELTEKARALINDGLCETFIKNSASVQQTLDTIKGLAENSSEHAQKNVVPVSIRGQSPIDSDYKMKANEVSMIPHAGPSSLSTIPGKQMPQHPLPAKPRAIGKSTRSRSRSPTRRGRDEFHAVPSLKGKEREMRFSPLPLNGEPLPNQLNRRSRSPPTRRSPSPSRYPSLREKPTKPKPHSRTRSPRRSPSPHIDRKYGPGRRHSGRFSPPPTSGQSLSSRFLPPPPSSASFRFSATNGYSPPPSSSKYSARDQSRSCSRSRSPARSGYGERSGIPHRLPAPRRRAYSPVRRTGPPRGWTRSPPPKGRIDSQQHSRVLVKQEPRDDDLGFRNRHSRQWSPIDLRDSPPPAPPYRRDPHRPYMHRRSPSDARNTKDLEYMGHRSGTRWIKREEAIESTAPLVFGVQTPIDVDKVDWSWPPPTASAQNQRKGASRDQSNEPGQIHESSSMEKSTSQSMGGEPGFGRPPTTRGMKSVFEMLEEEDRKPDIHELERLVQTMRQTQPTSFLDVPSSTTRESLDTVLQEEPNPTVANMQNGFHETIQVNEPDGVDETMQMDEESIETRKRKRSASLHEEEQDNEDEAEPLKVRWRPVSEDIPLVSSPEDISMVADQPIPAQKMQPSNEETMEIDDQNPHENNGKTESLPPPIVPCHFVPGVWLLQVGSKRIDTVDCRFTIDEITANKWLVGSGGVSDAAPNVEHLHPTLQSRLDLRLLCFATDRVNETLSSLKEDASLTEVAGVLSGLQESWPPMQDLIVMLNPETTKERVWLSHNLPSADKRSKTIQLERHVSVGENVLRIIQLNNLSRFTFVLYAGERPISELDKYLGRAQAELSNRLDVPNVVIGINSLVV